MSILRLKKAVNAQSQQAGTHEEIYEQPTTEFVARFIGRCNTMAGTLLASGQVDVSGLFIAANSRAEGVSPGHEGIKIH